MRAKIGNLISRVQIRHLCSADVQGNRQAPHERIVSCSGTYIYIYIYGGGNAMCNRPASKRINAIKVLMPQHAGRSKG